MAGHSKWANIRHRKGAQDAKRGKIFTKIIKEITVSARLGGGDQDSNPRLRKAVSTGKRRPVQLIYLAKALHRNGMKKEAVKLLEEASKIKPLPSYIVEYREKIDEAKGLLEEYRWD